jgi:hypothetical protein
MNLAAYIDALERSAQNLPSVLFEWAEIDDDLRAHYAESLVELLATHAEARRFAQAPGEQLRLSQAWGSFVYAVFTNARTIATLMELAPLDLLTPPSVSAAVPTAADALVEDDDCLPLAA